MKHGETRVLFGGRPNFHANPHQWIDLFDLRFRRESNCRISHGLFLLSSRKGAKTAPKWDDVLSPISPEMGGRNQTSFLVGPGRSIIDPVSEWI